MKKANCGRTRICMIVLALALSSDPALAMIRTLPLSELIERSDFIIIGRVTEQRKVAEVPKGPGSTEETIENIILPQEILKSKWPKGKKMIFATHRAVRDGKQMWWEDELSFPERDSRVVLFVTRERGGKLVIVNGIQGLWPLGEDGKPLGMGFRYSIEDLKREIAKTRPYKGPIR